MRQETAALGDRLGSLVRVVENKGNFFHYIRKHKVHPMEEYHTLRLKEQVFSNYTLLRGEQNTKFLGFPIEHIMPKKRGPRVVFFGTDIFGYKSPNVPIAPFAANFVTKVSHFLEGKRKQLSERTNTKLQKCRYIGGEGCA